MTGPAAGGGAGPGWRRHLLALMLSMAFAGGALFGLLAGSVGLPGVWWAPVVLAATGGFWLLTRSRR